MNNRAKLFVLPLLASGLLLAAAQAPAAPVTQNLNLCVRPVNKTMSDGQSVTFWGFLPPPGGGANCMFMVGAGQVPGPTIDLTTGDTLNLSLNITMAPQEAAPYNGHTVHLHGADVITAEDGVPETGASVSGDTYTWIPATNMVGSFMYHCHVHTVKHLDMGMYAPMIVRPRDTAGNTLPRQLTTRSATAFDVEQIYMISTADPAYHTAVGDSTVFADYNPKYFMLNGSEGLSTTAPALTTTARSGQKVALRLIGAHSVKALFSIRDSAGRVLPFTVYIEDGRELAAAEVYDSTHNNGVLEVMPGMRFDLIYTAPSVTAATSIYPQLEFRSMRDTAIAAGGKSMAYARITVNP